VGSIARGRVDGVSPRLGIPCWVCYHPFEAIPPRPERPEWGFQRTSYTNPNANPPKQFHRIPFFATSPPKWLCTEHPPRSLTCQSSLPPGGSNPCQNESVYTLHPNPTTISSGRTVTRPRPPSSREPPLLLNPVCLPPLHLCEPRFQAGKMTV